MTIAQTKRINEEDARSLAETAHRKALPALVELAEWRNKSGSTPQVIPYNTE